VAVDIVGAFGGSFALLDPLWHELSRSVHNVVPVMPPGVEDDNFPASWYSTNSEFYSACRQSILTATRDIRVTYIRQCPPDEVTSAEAAEYFAAILDWAAAPGRSATRVFGIPGQQSMARSKLLNFLHSHSREITERQLKNYTPLVYEYTARADGLNM